jgi:Domain of unknown function (DUF1737)
MTKGYILITADRLEDLEKKVNEHIELGWTPIGGPCFNRHATEARVEHGRFDVWVQALIR